MSTIHDRPTGSTPSDQARVDHLTSTTFDEAIATSDRPVLVDFTATWCPPCKQLTPVLHALAAEQADRLRIVEVDIDESPDLARPGAERADDGPLRRHATSGRPGGRSRTGPTARGPGPVPALSAVPRPVAIGPAVHHVGARAPRSWG